MWGRGGNFPYLSGGVCHCAGRNTRLGRSGGEGARGSLVVCQKLRNRFQRRNYGFHSHTYIHLLISYAEFTVREKFSTCLLGEDPNHLTHTIAVCSPCVFCILVHKERSCCRRKREIAPLSKLVLVLVRARVFLLPEGVYQLPDNFLFFFLKKSKGKEWGKPFFSAYIFKCYLHLKRGKRKAILISFTK